MEQSPQYPLPPYGGVVDTSEMTFPDTSDLVFQQDEYNLQQMDSYLLSGVFDSSYNLIYRIQLWVEQE